MPRDPLRRPRLALATGAGWQSRRQIPMTHNLPETDDLARRIEDAFSSCPRPDPDDMVEPDDGSPVAHELRRAFTGMTWREAPFQTLVYWGDVIDCFSARAWRYYLPAFLIATLRTQDPPLVDAMLETLTPLATDRGLTRFNERLALLGQEQREVIRDFIHQVWPLIHKEDDQGSPDCRAFWNDLVTIPNGIAAKPPPAEGA